MEARWQKKTGRPTLSVHARQCRERGERKRHTGNRQVSAAGARGFLGRDGSQRRKSETKALVLKRTGRKDQRPLRRSACSTRRRSGVAVGFRNAVLPKLGLWRWATSHSLSPLALAGPPPGGLARVGGGLLRAAADSALAELNTEIIREVRASFPTWAPRGERSRGKINDFKLPRFENVEASDSKWQNWNPKK